MIESNLMPMTARKKERTRLHRLAGTAVMVFTLGLLTSCSAIFAPEEASAPARPPSTKVSHNTLKPKVYGYSVPVKLSEQTGTEAASPPAPRKVSKPEKTAYLGSAPYICSPSGFGRKSSCFLR